MVSQNMLTTVRDFAISDIFAKPGAAYHSLVKWLRMFQNYVLDLADKIEDKRKHSLLI